jgi:predicted RecB family nuclease
MKNRDDRLTLSATDLSAHLGCHHLTQQSVLVETTNLTRPFYDDPTLELLRQKGTEHEEAYLEHLRGEGLSLKEFADHGPTTDDTLAAMREGHDVIFQAKLNQGRWTGRADFLLRTDGASDLGDYHYEVVDTKLARETRAGTVLQLCLYAELVGQLQGRRPDQVMVVSPGKGFEPEVFRVDHYYAYYQLVKRRLEEAVEWGGVSPSADVIQPETYPEPCPQCDICNWHQVCRDKRSDDDHLSLVAGISKLQRTELSEWGIETLTQLGEATLEPEKRPKRGTRQGLEKVQDQARVQLIGRNGKHPYHEMVRPVEGEGLTRLPEPSEGDVFFDLEGDAFAGDAFSETQSGAGGLEYLFGWVTVDDDAVAAESVDGGQRQYHAHWAYDADGEKQIFEQFMDAMVERRQRFPDMHIYHYAPYEPGALKRLMGRYATREEAVDDFLRHAVFVDLYGVVRQGVRCSVESYSIKRLEEFYEYEREQALPELGKQKRHFEAMLENGEGSQAPQEMRDIVQLYNEDDCVSTWKLRDWLEGLRAELVAAGTDVDRPVPPEATVSEERHERDQQVHDLREQLTRGIPVARSERSALQQGTWLLAHMLDWHWREDKVKYWEKFRLIELMEEDYLDERSAIGELEFVCDLEKVGKERTKRVRYRYPSQEIRIDVGADLLYGHEGEKFGTLIDLDYEARTVDVKKTGRSADVDPPSVFAWKFIPQKDQPRSVMMIAEWVAEHGIDGESSDDDPNLARAGRDLLMNLSPRLISGAHLRKPKEEVIERAVRLALELDHGVLPIQGPPGSGKTYTGGHMIAALVKAGKRVGVTAVSHKVIVNLMEAAVEAADKTGLSMTCVHRGQSDQVSPGITECGDNTEALNMLATGKAHVVGGTTWFWCREHAQDAVDVLFVDEAGQMSLANVLAASPCAKSIVLLGDPQQLEQPQQGSHPEGTEVSALEHVLSGAETMPEEMGLFLEKTWRLHPSICAYTSKLFYEGKLESKEGLEQQVLAGPTKYAGAGLWVETVEHEGNQNSSLEEVERVAEIVADLLQEGVTWTDMDGERKQIGAADILVVAPYNAQVADLQEKLPEGVAVGTVDRFQGQEAPVVIYSMATSSPEEAPRGMEFLYSLNRLNVATSRARCVCVMVANPALLEPACRSVRQMRLANGVSEMSIKSAIHEIDQGD